jgi:sporulation protein YlmC with PRC-barrel domain
MRLSDQSLHGKHVITADGTIIGNVHAVYIDGANLHLDCLAVEVRRELADRLGVQRSLFHKGIVEIPADQIQFIGQTIILAVPFANVRATAPERTPAHPQPTAKQPEPRTDGEKPIQPHPHM